MFRPLRDNILLRQVAANKMTKGGLHLPASADSTSRVISAEVLAVGPGRELKDGTNYPAQLRVGDVVMVLRHAGEKVRIDHEDLMVCRETDVLVATT